MNTHDTNPTKAAIFCIHDAQLIAEIATSQDSSHVSATCLLKSHFLVKIFRIFKSLLENQRIKWNIYVICFISSDPLAVNHWKYIIQFVWMEFFFVWTQSLQRCNFQIFIYVQSILSTGYEKHMWCSTLKGRTLRKLPVSHFITMIMVNVSHVLLFILRLCNIRLMPIFSRQKIKSFGRLV